MGRLIRQVFGTSRPKDIWLSLISFDRLVTKPIVHIVYWVGLGMFFIAALAVLGASVGSAWKDPSLMSILPLIPFLIFSWLGILIGILLWRSFCEFYLAVMSIADDLRHLRQYQEKLEPPVAEAPVAPAPYAPAVDAAAAPVAANTAEPARDPLEDPFFSPRFGSKREDTAI